MSGFFRDLRYGVRILVSDGRLTTAILLTMMLAIGANVAIFSIVNALAMRDVLSSQLVGVGANDPAIVSLSALFLSAIALSACYRPARRATRLDPLSALRCQ